MVKCEAQLIGRVGGGGGGNQLHLHKNKRICKITPFLLTMVLSEMKIDSAPQTVYNLEPS
jgi:hypothetical protein